MPAYLISDVTARDATAFQVYRTRAAASEGGWSPRTIIVVEFPDVARARAWYRSPEYASALEARDAALSRNLILVDGISEEP